MAHFDQKTPIKNKTSIDIDYMWVYNVKGV